MSDNNNEIQYWIELVAEFKSSGLAQKLFCEEKSISTRKFSRYKQLISIHKKLELLPLETSNNFAFEARKITDILNDPVKLFQEIIDDDIFPEKTRFNALYCLLAFLWQNREFEQYRNIVDKYENNFNDHVMLLTFRSQYYISKDRDVSNLKLALEYASRAKSKAPNLPNVLHLFTGIVSDLAEIDSGKVSNKLLLEAEQSIDKAIAIVSGKYARYFATKADLLGKIGRFSEAKKLIQKAIEVEPSAKDGYALRIGDYQQIRLKNQFLEHSKLLQTNQRESIEKLEEVRLRVIELLGILSAIIAFLVTSIQVGKGLAFHEAARLMVISGGVILVIFSSYSIIFFRSQLRFSQLTVLVFGATMIIVFYFFPELIHAVKNML